MRPTILPQALRMNRLLNILLMTPSDRQYSRNVRLDRRNWQRTKTMLGTLRGIMYRLIEKHIDTLLDSPAMSRDVQRYVWLLQHFREVNVATNTNFQERYRSYW